MRIGLEDDATTFTGYWEPECPARTDADNLLVSAYRLPDGAWALAPANRNQAPVEAPVTVDWKALGLSPADVIVTDEVAKAPRSLTDGKVKVAIKGYNDALIALRVPKL